MSCYYDYFVGACICEEKIEQIPLSQLFTFAMELLNV